TRAALDDDVVRSHRADVAGGSDHAIDGLDRLAAGEGRRLLQVGRDDGRQGDQVLDEEVLEVDHRAAALADQDRVEDVREVVLPQRGGERQGGVHGAQHPGLDDGELVDRERGLELTGDDVRVDERDVVLEVRGRVEGDDAGDHGSAE